MVSGAEGEHGHLEELRTDPIGLMQRVRDECGDVGRFTLADRTVVMLSGAEVNEWYFRTPDEVLDQAAAYPFMTPIFGKGVIFDAPPERRKEMLQTQALRGPQMRGHAETIADEVERAVAPWTAPMEIDLLDWFAELTIYTSSARSSGNNSTRALPSCTTTSNAEPTRSRTSIRTRQSRVSGVGTLRVWGWSSSSKASWPTVQCNPMTVTQTSSTCSCRSPTRVASRGSAPTR
jgi:hypothetical protein